MERSSEEDSPARNNTPAVLNSSQLSGAMARETIAISSVASLELQIVTIESDSNERTIPYGFHSQHQIVPPSLTDHNLPPSPLSVFATMAVIRTDEEYGPESPGPSIASPIPRPPMDVSTTEGWKTTHTSTEDATFYFEDEPRRVYWVIFSSESFDSNEPRHVSIASRASSTSPTPRQQKRKLSMGISFPKKKGVSQHTCEACGQPLRAKKTP